MIWGEGRRKLGEDLKVLYDNGYQGLISQELTMGNYYLDPVPYDKRNLSVLSEYFYWGGSLCLNC